MTLTVATRRRLWIGGALVGALMVAMGAYFLFVGLDQANKVAGVAGPFLSLIGIGLSWASIIQARSTSERPQRPARQSQSSGANSVNIQSTSDINIGNNNKFGGR
ncbi:hypothetical protein [Streptomyces sp. NPDC058867]|uniref:hypothetical protein n=1 Tax=unclassified Streptomyces TaxID=2593676 RepID=UPI0036A666D6